MNKSLATLLATGGVIFGGGIAIEDIVTADVVATLNDPITINEAISFRAPSHFVEVNDNGFIEIVVGDDKRYGLFPSKAADKTKSLFLAIDTKEQEVTYRNIYGAGSDLILKNTPRSFSKIVMLTNAFLKDVPADAEFVEVSFNLSGWNVPDGTYTDRIQLQQDVWLEKALAWDSSDGDPNQNYTDVEFVIENGTLTKRIPVEWLKTATFPIYTDATFTFGTKQLADVGPSGTVDVLPIGNDTAAICWHDNTAGTSPGECTVATVTGTTLSFGSPLSFVTDADGANNAASGACEAGNNRWVLVYNEDISPTTDLGRARVASSTGSTINGYGPSTTFFNATTTFPVCATIDTDTIIISYADNSSSRDQYVIACTIAVDYTLTCGSPVMLKDSTDTLADTSCVRVGTLRFTCIFESNNSAHGLMLRAGTVSGTTITLGTEVSATLNTAIDSFGHTLSSAKTDSFFFSFHNTSGANPVLGLGTLSGTSITLGATTTVIATTTSFSAISSIDDDSALLMYQQGATDAATTFLAAIPIQLNWSTLTFSTSSAETIDATTDPGSLHLAKISDCKFLFAWEDDNDTNDLFAKVGDINNCRPDITKYLRNAATYIKNGALYFKN